MTTISLLIYSTATLFPLTSDIAALSSNNLIAVVVVISGLLLFCSIVVLSLIILTATHNPFSFIPSKGAYNAAIVFILSGNKSNKKPALVCIKSIFTVEIEAYPVGGFDCIIKALQWFQSKFLPNSLFVPNEDIVLQPNVFD